MCILYCLHSYDFELTIPVPSRICYEDESRKQIPHYRKCFQKISIDRLQIYMHICYQQPAINLHCAEKLCLIFKLLIPNDQKQT